MLEPKYRICIFAIGCVSLLMYFTHRPFQHKIERHTASLRAWRRSCLNCICTSNIQSVVYLNDLFVFEANRMLKSWPNDCVQPSTARAFQRVKVEEVEIKDARLADNSYWAKVRLFLKAQFTRA